MISPACRPPLTLCTTAVSSSSSFLSFSSASSSSFIASSSSSLLSSAPSSSPLSLASSPGQSLLLHSLCATTAAPSSPYTSHTHSTSPPSSLWLSLLLLLLSFLVLPLRCLLSSLHRGSGPASLPRKPAHRPSLSRVSPLSGRHRPRVLTLLLLATHVTSAAAWPLGNSATSQVKAGVMPGASDATAHSTWASVTPASGLGWTTLGDPPPSRLEHSMQQDAPPRKTTGDQDDAFPTLWGVAQGRALYLRARNLQYLQVYNGAVSGTHQGRPDLGLMQSFYQEKNYVIMHYASRKFLCMDKDFRLYLGNSPTNRDCHLQNHVMKEFSGVYKNYYVFKERSTADRKRYLGINCRPVSWVADPENSTSVRFFEDYPEDIGEVNKVKRKLQRARSHDGLVSEVCTTPEERERQEREQTQRLEREEREREERKERRKKLKRVKKSLRQKWCWSLPRLEGRPQQEVLQQCHDRYSQWCGGEPNPGSAASPSHPPDAGKDCVCSILENMLAKPKRAKRKCLTSKIELWVHKQNITAGRPYAPNALAILESAKVLLPIYPAIARRMRETRCLKRRADHGKAKNTRKGRKSSCRRKRGGVKINEVLKQFANELVLQGEELTAVYATSPRPHRPLSAQFERKLLELVASSRRGRGGRPHRHRHRGRHGRRHRRRRRPRRRGKRGKGAERESRGSPG